MPVFDERDLKRGSVTPVKQGVKVYNGTGSTLAAGALVSISGWSETYKAWSVVLADANTTGLAAHYVLHEAITNTNTGRAYKGHRLRDVNTNGATVGDAVYLSATAGSWTLTSPVATIGSVVQKVGRVAVVSATVGEIEFNLADAAAPSPVDGSTVGATAAVAAGALSPTSFGVPVVIPLTVPAGATGDVDFTGVPYKIRVIDVWLVKTTNAGGGAGTIQLKNGANAISSAMSIDIADKTIARTTEIDDAQSDVAAAGTLRVTRTRTASTDESCIVYVKAIRVA